MWLLILGLWLGDSTLSARALEREIETVIEQEHFRDAFWGISIYAPLRQGYLLERNSQRNFRPASNLKILTTLLAMHYLGPDYRFQTMLGYNGTFDGRHVEGDLVLKAGGDPSFSGRYTAHYTTEDLVENLVSQLKREGVSVVYGDLVGDVSFFDDRTIQNSWEWDDLGYAYAVPITPLSLNDALYDIRLAVDEQGFPNWQVYPEKVSGFTLRDQLGEEKKLKLTRPWGTDAFTAQGTVKACDSRSFTRGSWFPARQFLEVLSQVLKQNGIEITGTIRLSHQVQDFKPLVIYNSDTLALCGQVLMKLSQNHYADAFLKTAAREVMGEGSFEAGSDLASQFLAEIVGPLGKGHRVRDGSGMSAQNYLKPHQLVSLLLFGLDAPFRKEWIATMPAFGLDGTLEERGDASTKGRVWAKTGYINRTRTLSGYLETTSGEPLVFSLMVNNYSCTTKEVEAAQDRLCALLRRLKLKRNLKRNPELFSLSGFFDQQTPYSYPLDALAP